jgi:ferredoxin
MEFSYRSPAGERFLETVILQIMMKYFITFSPTGGTKKVADAIVSTWGESEHIDLAAPSANFSNRCFCADDWVAIAMPVYNGRIPAFAAERLKQIKADGTKCLVIAVYGNRAYEDALIELNDTALQCGFKVIAGVAAVAEHSIMRQFASGRPDAADMNELAEFGKQVMEKFEAGDSVPAIPGNRPYRKAGAAFVPKAARNCNSCGICAKNCPVQAIDLTNPKQVDKSKCIGCFRCVAVCPSHSRRFSPIMLKLVSVLINKAFAGRKPNELFI